MKNRSAYISQRDCRTARTLRTEIKRAGYDQNSKTYSVELVFNWSFGTDLIELLDKIIEKGSPE